MGEYDNQAVAAEGTSFIDNATLYAEMAEVYRQLVEEIADTDASKVVKKQTVTYTADTESMDVTAFTTPISMTRIARVEDFQQVDYPIPMDRLTNHEYEEYLVNGALPDEGTGRGWYLESDNLYVVPRPASDLDIRIVYVPDIVEPTEANQDTTGPVLLPRRYYALLAADLAEVLAEGSVNPVHHRNLRRRFELWCHGSLGEETLYVHEV